jgi:hypothetical protein
MDKNIGISSSYTLILFSLLWDSITTFQYQQLEAEPAGWRLLFD